jgi:hypothetical protein
LSRAAQEDPFTPQSLQPSRPVQASSIYSQFGLSPSVVAACTNSNSIAIQSPPKRKTTKKKAAPKALPQQIKPHSLGGSTIEDVDEDDAPLSLRLRLKEGKTAVRLVASQHYLQLGLSRFTGPFPSLFPLPLHFFLNRCLKKPTAGTAASSEAPPQGGTPLVQSGRVRGGELHSVAVGEVISDGEVAGNVSFQGRKHGKITVSACQHSSLHNYYLQHPPPSPPLFNYQFFLSFSNQPQHANPSSD